MSEFRTWSEYIVNPAWQFHIEKDPFPLEGRISIGQEALEIQYNLSHIVIDADARLWSCGVLNCKVK